MKERNIPARIVAPGRIIIRELEARGWSQLDLATIMGRPEQMVSEIVRGKKEITAETARQLSRAFGTSPEFWMSLEMDYRLQRAEKQTKELDIATRSKLFNIAPVNELIKRGWIKPGKSLQDLEVELCQFLRIPNLNIVPEINASFRLSNDRGPEERAKIAWIRRVEFLGENQIIGDYHPEQLDTIIWELLKCAQKEDDIKNIPEILLNNGIHFIIVPHLAKTYLDGAAFWINNHPVIALSLRYDRIDAFWFTLLHELAHIKEPDRIFQIEEIIHHQKDDPSDEEIRADRIAAQWLVDECDILDFIEANRPRYSRKAIQTFASMINRHPGIIVGQLMHRKEVKFSHLRDYLIKISPFIGEWQDVSYPI